ncbi:MAG: ferredoxin, partial [Chitinophagaceae bacterium]|nr:ferredoxin [Chitinophagaceae bacterium]
MKKKMPVSLQAKLQLISVVVLFLLVPLRHAIFNTDGLATAILLMVLSTIAVIMGFIYDWKSGWCSTLCPVHPVERLYGSASIFSFPNAHCENCVNCSIPCPDSTPNFHPGISKKTSWHSWSGWLIAGGLPGFVWAWFHVPDQHGIGSMSEIITIYQIPFLGL